MVLIFVVITLMLFKWNFQVLLLWQFCRIRLDFLFHCLRGSVILIEKLAEFEDHFGVLKSNWKLFEHIWGSHWHRWEIVLWFWLSRSLFECVIFSRNVEFIKIWWIFSNWSPNLCIYRQIGYLFNVELMLFWCYSFINICATGWVFSGRWIIELRWTKPNFATIQTSFFYWQR